VGLVSDIISCPGLDYCSLANTRSIPIAQAISERFADPARAAEIGRLHLNISGCINACGHHHVGHIGILGVDKKDEEFFQIALGGKGNFKARLGELIGPAIPESEIVDAVERIVDTYLELRTSPSETFIAAVERLGLDPFKERAYASR
jgi:sulfite reductase (NADPH) hemoprotein beta-component